MDSNIEADLYRYDGLTGFRGLLRGIISEPGFRYMFILRNASKSRKFTLKWLFFKILKHRYTYRYGFQIPTFTEIGGGFHIGHFGTIIINKEAKIGKNCNIAPGVTIGQSNRGSRKGCPTIGDKVWIGTGSIIVGKITIESNVLIAPNSFVNIDIPKNSLVIGNPAKIISKENATEGYIDFII